MRWLAVFAATSLLVMSVVVPSNLSADEAVQLYRAAQLDQQGKLAEALPLYRAQAEKTLTKSDRLRYASALMRSERADQAKTVYDQIAREAVSVEHGGDGVARGPAVCASSLLTNGFPAAALPYAWQAHRLRASDPTLALLLVRAMAASGDVRAARAMLDELARDPRKWIVGQRIELARWRLLTGDAQSARQLLEGDLSESVGQMFRDSIFANVPLREGQWVKAAEILAESERKVPSGLGEKRVDRTWRNAQRELWSVQLRRAISLWKAGKTDQAVAEAARAQRSDEEYVRSAATLLVTAADLAHGRRPEASARLQALAGHDPRFAGAVSELEKALTSATDPRPATHTLQATLGGLDRSVDFVAQPLCEIVADAARPQATALAPAARRDVEPVTASNGR